MGEIDYLPISMLNQLEYCERRFYLMHVLGEMEINAHVQEGIWRHAQAHSGQAERQESRLIHRRVYVWSERLELAGFCDVVEQITAGQASGSLLPVEYKKGRMGRWLNDHVQLCAQAMCLEERSGLAIEEGSLFYFGSRRRQQVAFTPELRQRTEQAVQRARQLAASGRLPAPLAQEGRCRDCSLERVCLPGEVGVLTGRTG